MPHSHRPLIIFTKILIAFALSVPAFAKKPTNPGGGGGGDSGPSYQIIELDNFDGLLSGYCL